jgi:hypothetical protein
MPNFPFQRAKPLGYALYEVLTSAQANTIDQNAAQAADGLVWTDVAAFRNWSAPQTLANSALTAVHIADADSWVVFGVSATNPAGYLLNGSSGVFQAMSATTSATALTIRKRAADYNPSSGVALFGGLPGASSNKKYVRYSMVAPLNPTMATIASSQTNTNAVTCIKWAATPGLWIAGHDGSGVVETSPDGLTFTSRTVPNIDPRISMAVGPAGVVISANVNVNKVIHSTDGINWFERTLPATRIWRSVVYVPLLGKYVALCDTFDAIAYSTDAINWSNQAFTLPPNLSSISPNDAPTVGFGRTIFTMARQTAGANTGLYSQDGGATWTYSGTFPTSSSGCLATSGKQLAYGDGTSLYLTFGGGF